MKRLIITTILLAMLILLVNCDEKTVYVTEPITPVTPTGLTSITGDGLIQLMWYPVDMDNIDEYAIYWASGESDPTDSDNYQYMASVDAAYSSYSDYDVENGSTYYYAIAAFNTDGDGSYLSNYVMDTPRPEGHNVRLYDINQSETIDSSGYDIYYQEYLPYDSSYCDIYPVYSTTYGCFFLTVRHNDYFIQDYGYAADFDDVGYAPPDGWSAFSDVEVIEGHMYMLKLNHFDEDHYAKVWVTDVNETSGNRYITFSWAYQIAADNRELKIGDRPIKLKSESVELN